MAPLEAAPFGYRGGGQNGEGLAGTVEPEEGQAPPRGGAGSHGRLVCRAILVTEKHDDAHDHGDGGNGAGEEAEQFHD